ncbi:ParB/RepB/Spo0J family partition protein [Janthinobacterium sp. CAN_S7]|uniref:ParB/RepB/Spo0J family partition protein n=1 Tax=Janthinobacterium sp. CAN_S7 TaxID=3071704 RepID=UPI00319E1634
MASAAQRLSERAAAAKGATPVATISEIEIPLAKLRFDPTQPRKAFHQLDGRIDVSDEEYIAELAEMIREQGLIHAITVREMPDGTYLVVVGECRTRAHLLLGRATIRAVVRNDLTGRRDRLIYQVVENIGRKDLNDYEVAEAIRELMQGSDESPAMKQVEIAKLFGKSEGWISKFVKFGDEELQRVWVKSGIANTPDKVTWLSALPMALQMDIRRRVELPESDPEWLVKPLQRDVLDRLKKEAKTGSRQEVGRSGDFGLPKLPVENVRSQAASAGMGAGTGDSLAAGGAQAEAAVFGSNGVAADDAVGQAFAAMAKDGRQEETQAPNGGATAETAPTSTYQLPADARAAILQSTSVAVARGEALAAGEVVTPPVRCKVAVQNILALADVLRSNPELSKSVSSVWCDLSVPGEVAQLVANELMGVIVGDKDVSATLQRELAKLR